MANAKFPEFEMDKGSREIFVGLSNYQVLAVALDENESSRMRGIALRELGLRGKDNVEELTNIFWNNEKLRYDACVALCSVLEPTVTPSLLRILQYKGENGELYRRDAVIALGRLKQSDTLNYLADLLMREEWYVVLDEIVVSFAQFGVLALPILDLIVKGHFRYVEPRKQLEISHYAQLAINLIVQGSTN